MTKFLAKEQIVFLDGCIDSHKCANFDGKNMVYTIPVDGNYVCKYKDGTIIEKFFKAGEVIEGRLDLMLSLNKV